MIISSISLVKNESDIIESFIRYNLQYIDQMHIIDHNSADSTVLIINKLINEGLPIILHKIDSPEYLQGQWITEYSKNIANNSNTDIIIPIDADEFLLFDGDRNQFNNILSPALEKPVLYPWVTYVPSLNDNLSEPDPLKRITHRRKNEGDQFYKTIFPAKLMLKHSHEVSVGSHLIIRNDKKKVPHENINNLKLAHLPIRSKEQMTGKIIIGELSFRLKKDRSAGEGFHWAEIYKQIRHNLNSLEHKHVCQLAVDYASKEKHKIVSDPIRLPYDKLAYPELINTDVLNRVIAFTEQVISINSNSRKPNNKSLINRIGDFLVKKNT